MISVLTPRLAPAVLAAAALAIASAASAQQQPASSRASAASSGAKPSQRTAAKPQARQVGPSGQATLVETFGAWGVYAAKSGASKLCYALSQPRSREPKGLNRDPAYLFVSFRPAENVRNEIALVLGFPAKDGGPADASIGPEKFALVTKGQNAWVKNPAEEGQFISMMTKVQAVVVRATSARGNQLTDRYGLDGFGKALDRARKECL